MCLQQYIRTVFLGILSRNFERWAFTHVFFTPAMAQINVQGLVLLNINGDRVKIISEPKSIKMLPVEWSQLRSIAQRRGISRHRLMTDAMGNILNTQNPDVA